MLPCFAIIYVVILLPCDRALHTVPTVLHCANPRLPGVRAGIIERIGDTVNSCLIAKSSNPEQPQKWNEKLPVKDHVSAMQHILGFLSKNVSTSIDRDVQAVGHRIVHGLTIHKAVLLDDSVLREVEKAATLAPLHNPPGLQGVHAAKSVFKGVPQVRRAP